MGFADNPAGQVVTRTRSNTLYRYTGYVDRQEAYTPNGLNQYTSVGGTAFTHDANGNLTSDGSNSYSYDDENRLTGVTGARTANLSYDLQGRLYRFTSSAEGGLHDGDAAGCRFDHSNMTKMAFRHE